MKHTITILLITILATTTAWSQQKNLAALLKAKQYAKLEMANNNPGHNNYYYYKAIFANVCNDPARANQYLDILEKTGIPADLAFEYWKLRADNYMKLFEYKKAYEINHYINENFKSSFSADHYKGSITTELIWKALQDEPPQRIGLNRPVKVPYTKDFGGLLNVKVKINAIDTNFVFDTGAGISVITSSLASKLGLKIYDKDSIRVSGFTSIGNQTKIAVADSIRIGELVVYHPYFIIFNDEALTFADGQYKINGILGFPVMKEVGSITITRSDIEFSNHFKVKSVREKNMFTEYLHPIVMLKFKGDNLPFCFDTGGNQTLFSRTFYERYKNTLEKAPHQQGAQKIASAGGEIGYQSITMDKLTLQLNKKRLPLQHIEINTEGYHRFGEAFYGNFGKDILEQYAKIVISFKGNYLELSN